MRIIVCGNTFDVPYYKFNVDDKGLVDVIIAADKDTLESIAEFSMLGYNIREVEPFDRVYGRASHIALYARLEFQAFFTEDLMPY